MPPRKTSSKAAATDEEATGTEPSTYLTKASELAADTREFVEGVRGDLEDLLARHRELGEEEPAPEDSAATNAARHIPMSAGDLTRALDALHAAAADLEQKSAR